ncbi:hypothetical protein BCR35DRAFT_304355 [Leucosporidium creatinivorum]|uniref:Arrestin-like N-terminal domain-containing protein n=1 Tax=Leucosporidium creatinivorum TaxID=106004 RepID=A0A1Y2FA70_9BASI|nr:hypothetical protein BCR35DRAFT_304355 [Leucosporidium creatinivorum]
MASGSTTRSNSRAPSPTEEWDPTFRRLHHLQRPSRPGSLSASSRSRSASPCTGLFGKMGLTTPTLEVHLLEHQLFLKPSIDENTPTNDPVVQGTVTLLLPKARTLRHLAVRVLGRQDIGWSDNRPYESSIVLDREVTLHDSLSSKSDDDDAHLRLERGEHTWEFSIIVPSSTPTYERSPWGRVRHRVVARAKGLGKLGSEVTSVEKELMLVVNPGGAGHSSPPPSLHARIEGTLDTVCPFGIELQSQHMMVGGLLLFRFNLLPLADRPLVIASIAVTLRQYFTLQSPTDLDHITHPPPDELRLAFLDGSHPPNQGALDADYAYHAYPSTSEPLWASGDTAQQLTLKHLVRLPKDTILRPSTLPGTKAWISLRHVVEVEILYHVPRADGTLGEQQRVAVVKPLEIYSCGAHLPSLMLPEYSFDNPLPEGPPEETPFCLCAMPLHR